MFDKILIANRGEIACRVIRTARRMNIRTVAVYSEADKEALHVKQADEAVGIGPALATESYLAIDRIIEACKETGAQAVHPGYGFLAENPAFAAALSDHGIVFIGPTVEALTTMGDKLASKKLAMESGVRTVPGQADVISDGEQAVTAAREIGYPVMLKAAAGGGGKGMRIAWNDEECRAGYERATSEARSSFGDGRVFVEKYIPEPRHIEIQVMADRHSGVIHLGERECSLQRRHQKVIEESPSPLVDEAVRLEMGEKAVALARAAGYESAGTVEFMVDTDRSYYFLEMNTRLQVEHPVTELVTGLDLVELMIRVAAGEPLPLRQDDVTMSGWAIEARVYAEDPFRDFLPSAGRLVRYLPPTESESVRIDTGVCEGGEVSLYYDPLMAKVITRGVTRAEAIQHMRTALSEFYIKGVSHNLSFLSALVAHPRFAEGRLSTAFVAEEYPLGFHAEEVAPEDVALLVAVAATVHNRGTDRATQAGGRTGGTETRVPAQWVVLLGEDEFAVQMQADDGVHRVLLEGESFEVRSEWRPGLPLFRGTFNGVPVCLQVEPEGIGYRISYDGSRVLAKVLTPRTAELYRLTPHKPPSGLSPFLLSPMPGLLLKVSVKQGDEVRAGEELAVIEAMKMENVLRAARDGKVKCVLAEPAASLAADQPILEFE